MMTEFFVDTSAWFPVVHAGHADHRRLAQLLIDKRQSGARPITSNLVIAETHALLLRRVHRKSALAFLREVARVPDLIINSTRDLETRAIRDWLERYADQDFSLVDAVSFEVMVERGIGEALALDHHFATAGFQLVAG